MLVGIAPHGVSAAQERGGGSYTNPDFGFSVEWDDSIWQGNETEDQAGVELSSDFAYGVIGVLDGYTDGAENCLTDSAAYFADQENFSEFDQAPRRVERPATVEGAFGELFTYVNTGSDDAEMALYVECRDLDGSGAVLRIVFLTYGADYESSIGDLEDVLSAVSLPTDKKSSNKGPKAGKTGIKGTTYTDAELGFTVTWDEDEWNVVQIEDEESLGKGIEVNTESSYGLITGDEKRVQFADCATEFAEGIGAAPNMLKFRKAPRSRELPETAPDAVGGLYTYVDADSEVKMIGYFECREIDADNVVMIVIATSSSIYEDELPVWNDLLAGIEIGTTKTNDGKIGKSDDGGDEPIVEGTTFVGENFGFELTYDDSIWVGNDLTDAGNDFLDLESDLAIGSIIGFDMPYDGPSCVQTLAELKQGDGVSGFDVAPRSLDRPETVDGAEAELFTYSLETDQGSMDVILYVECRALAGGDASLGITFVTLPDVYENALPEIEKVLAGFDGVEGIEA